MKFSAKGEYGVRAILDIAFYGKRKPVRVRDIARRQAIPLRFLEQVMSLLKKAGLVESYRGAQGGYRLKLPASKINLADIVQSVEGPIVLMECVGAGDVSGCDQVSMCVIRDIWVDVQDSVIKTLESVTLEDVLLRKKEKDHKASPSYQI